MDDDSGNDDQQTGDTITGEEYHEWLLAVQRGEDPRIIREVLRDEQGRIMGLLRRPLRTP